MEINPQFNKLEKSKISPQKHNKAYNKSMTEWSRAKKNSRLTIRNTILWKKKSLENKLATS